MALSLYVQKIFGAVILLALTFISTLLPYKLKNVSKIKLRAVKCFCGGVSNLLYQKLPICPFVIL